MTAFVLTARVTDAEGNTASAPVPVTVGTAGVPPSIVDARFADGWGGCQNNSGGDPSPASGAFSIRRVQLPDGSWVARSTYAPTSSDAAIALTRFFGARGYVVALIDFSWHGTLPTGHHKWIRFQTDGWNGVHGGLYLTTDGISWCFGESNPGNLDLFLLVGGSRIVPTPDVRHTIKVEYDAANNRARFWYDGALVTGMALSNVTNVTFDPATGWLDCAASCPKPAMLAFDDTYNAGNRGSGYFDYHRVALGAAMFDG